MFGRCFGNPMREKNETTQRKFAPTLDRPATGHWTRAQKMKVVNQVNKGEYSINEIAKFCGLSWFAVNQWVKLVRRHGARGLNREASPRKGKTVLNEEQEQVIKDHRKRYQRLEMSIERVALIKKVREQVLEKGDAVSESTIRRHLSKIVIEDYADDDTPVRQTGQLLEQAELDHKKLKVIIVRDLGDGTSRIIGRAWLTSMVEIVSGAILGLDVYLHHPNTTALARVLTHAAYPKPDYPLWPYGQPNLVRLDNAREFDNEGLYMGIAEHEMQVEKRPSMTPSSGAYIESFYATLDHLLKDLPGGYIRLSTGKVKLASRPTLTLQQLKELIIHAVYLYHYKPHSGLNDMTPMEVWELGLIGGDTVAGLAEIALPNVSKQQYEFDFSRFERKTLRDGKKGFVIDHHTYYTAWLEPYVKAGKRGKWDTRVPDHTMNEIYVKPPDKDIYVPVPLRDVGRGDYSGFEARRACESLRRKLGLEKGERLTVPMPQIREEVKLLRLELEANASRSRKDARDLEIIDEQAERRVQSETESVKPSEEKADVPEPVPSSGTHPFRVGRRRRD